MMGMMMTSCQKDEGLSKDTFTATTENGNSKTHLDGLNLKWDDEGESIVVMGSNYQWAEYFATSVTNDNTCATFACREGEEVNADAYQIYYPATMVTANGTIELSATQEYAENNVKGFPMYAEAQSHAFQFTNLCGLFRLQLQKDDVVVRSISITTDKAVNGAFAVSTSAVGAFQFEARTANDDEDKTVTLDCGEGVSIDELTDFNIYLPAGTYSRFDITITTVDGKECVKSLNAGNTLTINRNERVTLVREGEELEFVNAFGHLPGLFSVSATKQVYFAKGNLQYVNGEWRFAEHQYDYLGTFSTTAWDLFGWSTDFTDRTSFGMSTITNADLYYGNFVDWGTAIGDGHTWYTLSKNEWSYLLNSRTGATSRFGSATVNGIHGIILLPDTWTIPDGQTFNSGMNYWQNNQYDVEQWAEMEASGAVFLPTAGVREHGMRIGGVTENGCYWTSTPNGRYYAYHFHFESIIQRFRSDQIRSTGYAVRLVQNQ